MGILMVEPPGSGKPTAVVPAANSRRRVTLETVGVPIRYARGPTALRTTQDGTRVASYERVTIKLDAGEALHAISLRDQDAPVRVDTNTPKREDSTAVIQSVEAPGDKAAREGRTYTDELNGTVADGGVETELFTPPTSVLNVVGVDGYRIESVSIRTDAGSGVSAKIDVEDQVTSTGTSGTPIHTEYAGPNPADTVKFDPAVAVDEMDESEAQPYQVRVDITNDSGSSVNYDVAVNSWYEVRE